MTRLDLPRARPRWLVPVLIVVVSLTVGGGLLTRELYRLPEDEEAEAGVTAPTSASLAPDEQPGSPVAELTAGAAAHPENAAVRQVIQTYVDAINGRDYRLWTTTVTRERVLSRSEEQWRYQYRSTRDGSVLVHRIESVPGSGLRVLLGLTSTQDPADAPADQPVRCIRWQLTLPLTVEGGGWKIDSVPAGSSPEYAPC